MNKPLTLLVSLLALTSAPSAEAQEKIRVGIIATLSGPPANVGQQIRNGFELAVKELNGKLGGRPIEVIVQDDELKPDVALTKARALVERDKVEFVVGPVFSNILQAIIKPVTDSGVILISPNPGTSNFAGKECNPNFFVTSIQNDQGSEAMGKYAVDKGFKKVLAIAPNYQAGRDMIAGFKKSYSSNLTDEIYVPLNQLDFSAELTRIASDAPQAIFVFLPGGMGVNFVKQFHQAGLPERVVFLSVFTADEATLPAQRDAALGILAGSNWAPNLDNPQSKRFVADYEQTFNAVPATYAAFGYDTAHLIDAALKTTKGATSDKAALRAALMGANFQSVRGSFKFNTNHYPVQDIYLTKVAKRADGKFQTEIVEKIFANYADQYVGQCNMK